MKILAKICKRGSKNLLTFARFHPAGEGECVLPDVLGEHGDDGLVGLDGHLGEAHPGLPEHGVAAVTEQGLVRAARSYAQVLSRPGNKTFSEHLPLEQRETYFRTSAHVSTVPGNSFI